MQVYLDSADVAVMRDARDVDGFTTNPTLARLAGVAKYRAFALRALAAAGSRPVSIEILADAPGDMGEEAAAIAALGSNAVVKVPVTHIDGSSTDWLVRELASAGVPINVTAVFTIDQVRQAGEAAARGDGLVIVSVFAGRIADTGIDPVPHVKKCKNVLSKVCPRARMLWASPRQAYDFTLAEKAECDIITMTPALLKRRAEAFGRNLEEFSRQTVREFFDAGQASDFTL